MNPSTVFEKSKKVLARKMEDEFILVPIAENRIGMEDKIYLLNETGCAIWHHIDGKTTLDQLVRTISKRYNSASQDEIREDIITLVNDLLKHNIIIINSK